MDPQLARQYRAQVEQLRQKHRTGLVTLLFTDIVGSTELKQRHGAAAALGLIERHHVAVRDLLRPFAGAEEISTAGDSFSLVFAQPSDAVRLALRLHARLTWPAARRETSVLANRTSNRRRSCHDQSMAQKQQSSGSAQHYIRR